MTPNALLLREFRADTRSERENGRIVEIEIKMIFWMAVVSSSVFACLLLVYFITRLVYIFRNLSDFARSHKNFLPAADIPPPLVRTELDPVPLLAVRTIIEGQRISYGAR